jgi:hypothetical protein
MLTGQSALVMHLHVHLALADNNTTSLIQTVHQWHYDNLHVILKINRPLNAL